jgi:hypothetical protein
MIQLQMAVQEKDGRATPVRVLIEEVLLAGYTGRDRSTVMEHLHELKRLGVAPPDHVPSVFTVSPELLTTDARLTVSGAETSGEVEFYLLPSPEGLLVGLGSDHTDRKHEAVDVTVAKAMCPKAVSRELWRYADIREHWDEIEIRAWVTDARGRQPYQDGRLDAFLAVDDLLAEIRRAGHANLDGRIVFGGTLPTLGGFVYAQRFDAELRDPILNRVISRGYEVVVSSA